MVVRIDINCDMGESFGTYKKGRDDEVMPYITSANIAGGFHAGDPHVMRRTVRLADEHGVSVGAHPGLPDKLGFGRRLIAASPQEAQDYVIYQLGALRAFADQYDVPFQHVKPHGAMYHVMNQSEEHARAVFEGVAAVDPNLSYLAPDVETYELLQDYPLHSVLEGYVDIDYDDDRKLIIPEGSKGMRDPETVADKFVRLAVDGEIVSVNGKTLDLPAGSICIHGDMPNVIDVLEEIHRRIEEHGIQLVSLAEMRP